ncbi:hypothetical protein BGZ58_002208 [Dissophora ornata]|nr:hypothetical protein BGZ58_002208 [Dissophora ornata]
MGTHPSKLNRVVSRSTIDSTSSSKDKKKFHLNNNANKDLADLSSVDTSCNNSSADKEDSQLTSETPTANGAGTAIHSIATTSESGTTTSKSNLSSFLSGLRSKASDADQGANSDDKSKAEEDRRLTILPAFHALSPCFFTIITLVGTAITSNPIRKIERLQWNIFSIRNGVYSYVISPVINESTAQYKCKRNHGLHTENAAFGCTEFT